MSEMNKNGGFLSVLKEMKKTFPKKVKTYPSDPIKILKGAGNIIGEPDREHLAFLKESNGASILDYCFWGIKNTRLYPRNIYEEMMDVWYKDELTALKFWIVAGNSAGECFGYLPQKNKTGGHFIGFYKRSEAGKIHIIASSFNIFLEKFIAAAQKVLNLPEETYDIDYSDFLDKNQAIVNDPELEEYFAQGGSALFEQAKLA